MDNQLLLEIMKNQLILYKQLVRMLPPRQHDIDVSAAAYEPGFYFTLYVGVEGDVVGIDEQGNAFNRHFIAGYHPFACKKIDTLANGTTATDLAACYAPD